MIVPWSVTKSLTAQQTTIGCRVIFPSRETYKWRERKKMRQRGKRKSGIINNAEKIFFEK
jgi:hypothetical protein